MKWLEAAKVIARRLRPGAFGWSGNYPDWETAQLHCSGYNAANILEKVKQATLKVKQGQAVYERDAVLFDEIEYSWPLLSALLWVAARKNGRLHVLDVGGSLGSTYFQNKNFLSRLENVQWSIIEQPEFVACGRQYIQDDILQFFNSAEECIQGRGLPDILVIACTLPYIGQPYELLDRLMSLRIPQLIIDNTPFNYMHGNRVTVQRVDPQIYAASYPCWFLDYTTVREHVGSQYRIVSEHKNDSIIFLDGHKIQYRGFLAELK